MVYFILIPLVYIILSIMLYIGVAVVAWWDLERRYGND